MIVLTDNQINTLIGSFVWPFARIMALLATDPLYTSRSLPKRAKAGFALLLTLLVAPLLPAIPSVPIVSAQGASILIQQILIGSAMGFVMRIVITSIELAGLVMANQMGLGFAMVFDPIHSAQVPTLSRLLSLFVFLLFLFFDGHLIVISTLLDSFSTMPIGQTVPVLTWRQLAEWGAHLFSWAAWLALPVIAALTVTNIAIGVMSRASPQFSIFSFGFPLTIGIGFVVLYLTIPMMVPLIEQFYRLSFDFMSSLFKLQ